MAEAAVGLTLGVISLAALFTTCIELADYIRLVDTHGKDYELLYTKFLLLKARLAAWGDALHVLNPGHENEQLRACWPFEKEAIGRSLIAVRMLLQDAKKLEAKYGLREVDDLGTFGESSALKFSDNLRQLETSLQVISVRRQKVASWGRRVVWAIRDKKSFELLVTDFAFHIDQLEAFAAQLRVRTVERLHSTISNIREPGAIALLGDAMAVPELNLDHEGSVVEDVQINPNNTSRGHLYLRQIISGQARVLQGDLGLHENHGARHVYADNQILGDARVIQGNTSGDHLRDLWSL